MKRLLAITLIMLIFSTSLSFADSLEEININNPDVNVAAELLKTLNILSEADIMGNSGFVTKEAFAEYLGKLLKLDGVISGQASYYNDVSGQSIINVLTDLKIFDIPAEKAFNPNSEITAHEMVKSLVNALIVYIIQDNDVVIDNYNYPQIAKRLGIVSSYNAVSKVTFKEMAGMMFNTLLVKVSQLHSLVYYTSDKSYKFSKDDTLLSILYDVYLVKGLVTANTYVSIYENITPTAADRIMIDAQLYNCKDAKALDYIGQYVVAFYKQKDSNDLKNIINISLDSVKNDCIEIFSEDVISYDKMVLKYMKNDTLDTVEFEKPLLIYNGEALFDLGVKDIVDILMRDRTKIRFCKSSYDTKTSLVFADHYVNGTVDYTDSLNKSIYVRFGDILKEIPVNKDDGEIYAATFNEDGSLLSFADIKIGDLVSCTISENERIYKTHLCTKTVTGKITDITYEGEKTYVTINDNSYVVEQTLADRKVLNLDDTNTYIIDYLGYIADILYYDDEGYVLGYIYGRMQTKGLSKEYRYKIYTQNNKHIIVISSKKAEIDGRIKSADDIDAVLAPGGILKRQLVRIKINKDNYLKSIDTTERTDEESDTSLIKIADTGDYISEAQSTTGQFMFWTDISGSDSLTFPCRPSTVVFGVPPEDSEDLEEKAFSISDCKDGIKHQITYRAAFYKFSGEKSYFVDVVVHERKSPWPWRNEDEVYMVNDVSQVLLDGEKYIAINALSSAVSGSVRLLCSMSANITINEKERTVSGDELISLIGSGDLIQVGGSADGSISHIRVLFDYSENKTFWSEDGYSYEFSTTDNDSVYGVRYRTLKCVYGYISDIKATKDKNRVYVYIGDFNTGQVKYSYSIGSNAGINIFDEQRNYAKAYKSYSRDLFSLASVGDIAKATRCFVAVNGDNDILMYFFN